MQQATFNQEPSAVIQVQKRKIYCFDSNKQNIDISVVQFFSDEWKKYHEFTDAEIEITAKKHFDIINETIVNKNTYGIDIGCGTGRWTKYLLDKIGFMEAMDPSDSIIVADKLLENKENVRLIKGSIDNIPFNDETFDFGMSIGVFHYVPDPQKAIIDCVKKIKIGGYFHLYVYYNLENKGLIFKSLLSIVTIVRKKISSLTLKNKMAVSRAIAIIIYMPLVLLGRGLKKLKLDSLAKKLPLSTYQNHSFYVMKNDALNRFGTVIEHRFSRKEVEKLMHNAGLGEIVISNNSPFWHAIGKRVK